MAIRRCPACSRQLGAGSTRCLHCGYRSTSGRQAVLLLLVAVLSATAGAATAMQRSDAGRRALAELLALTGARAANAADSAPPPIPVVIDVSTIAGKTPPEVAGILGAPVRRGAAASDGKNYPAYHYRNGRVQVVFVDGKADWITIQRLDSVPFARHALGAFGLPVAVPSSESAEVIRWTRVAGLRELSIFARPDSGVDYATVFVRSEP